MKFDFNDKNEYIRIFKYALVGVANTLIDWIIYFVLAEFFHVDAWIANVVGYSVGTCASFVGNKFFTFKAKNTKTGVEFAKFVAVNIVSLVSSTGIIALLTSVLAVNKYIAKIVSTCVSMAINYMGSRFFVFDKNNGELKK